MNELTDNIPMHDTQKKFTLKVLFGPMFGCELHLPAVDYFLIINSGIALQSPATIDPGDHAAAYAQNMLYLPCDIPSPNIILCLSAPLHAENSDDVYRLEVQGTDKSFPALLKENEVFVHEHIRFAVKRSEDEWPEEIKNFNFPPVLFDAELNGQDKREESKTKKNRLHVLCSIIPLLLLVIIPSVILYKTLDSERQVLTLNETLAGAPMPVEIVRGRENNLTYILTQDFQTIEWTREALIKLKGKSVVPVWLSQQRNELIYQLANAGYPVLQINYSIPQHPVIALYRSLPSQEESNLKSIALQKIPFALDINILVKTKIQLLQEARQGLDRMHIYYRLINSSGRYALVVRDALSDSALQALQHFIKQFNHQWGNREINFSINLDENWLQDKSYVDSSNGYLFMNPRHWYFPLNKGDLNG